MILCLSFLVSFSLTVFAQDNTDLFSPGEIKKKLNGDGLIGQVHGANPVTHVYALTLRDPHNFFIHKEFPLVWENDLVAAEFKSLKRHQTVRVFGDLVDNEAPLTHILVTKFQIEKNYTSETDDHEYVPKTNPSELDGKTNLIGRVHAVDQGGKVLVVEYKDLVLPVFVRDEATIQAAQKLFRGDKISLDYKSKSFPDSPKHLMTNPTENGRPAFQVLESVVQFHQTPVTREGYLVKFPKSPQISTDTYAILVQDSEGSTVQWTVVNFENMELFVKIREKLATLWNSDQNNVINGRNKLINMNVIVRVSGMGNVVDPGQANPQILVSSLDHIQLITK